MSLFPMRYYPKGRAWKNEGSQKVQEVEIYPLFVAPTITSTSGTFFYFLFLISMIIVLNKIFYSQPNMLSPSHHPCTYMTVLWCEIRH